MCRSMCSFSGIIVFLSTEKMSLIWMSPKRPFGSYPVMLAYSLECPLCETRGIGDGVIDALECYPGTNASDDL
jgi:hypothetical protein